MKTFDQLSDDERTAIAKECEKRHFICVASEYHVDAHTAAMCTTWWKLKDTNK